MPSPFFAISSTLSLIGVDMSLLKTSGEKVLSTVAGRELALEKPAAFGFLNPRQWIDLIFPPEVQARLVTSTARKFPGIVPKK